MADEKVTIKIEVNADNRQIRQTRRQLRALGAEAALVDKKGMASSQLATMALSKILDSREARWKKHFDEVDAMVKGFGRLMSKAFSGISKLVALEFGAMTLAVIGIHAAFATGQFIMKAYRASLAALAGGAAAAATALATVAAAMREQQAAMFAYKGKGSAEFGSGLNQTRQMMRSLYTDASLASVGMENLNKAFAAVSKTSTFNAGSQRMLKGLMDFASAGQPIDQGIQKAGELIAVLQDTKKGWYQVKAAAKSLGPEMEKALSEAAKQGINTKQELIDAINSGQLSILGGVSGQFDAVGGTLIARLKGYFNTAIQQFADLGQEFIEPVKQAAHEVFRIFERGFVKTAGLTRTFGIQTVLDTVVDLAEKLEKFYVDLMFTYLSKAEGMFQRIGDWWKRFTDGWKNALNVLRPFIDGARVLESMLGKIWNPIKEEGIKNFKQFNKLVQKNESNFMKFGTKLGEVIASFMSLTAKIKEMFIDILPFINRVLDGAKLILEAFKGILGTLDGIGNIFGNNEFGSLFAFLGLRTTFSAMSKTKGGFIAAQNTANMNVNAQVVNVGGPGGQYASSFAALAGLAGLAPGGATGQPMLPGFASAGMGPAAIGGVALSSALMSAAESGMIKPSSGWQYKAPEGKPAVGMPPPGMASAPVDPTTAAALAAKKTYEQLFQAAPPGYVPKPSKYQKYIGSNLREWRNSPAMKNFNARMARPGAMMGSSLGLSLLSQYGPKESQGALALGSLVSSADPRAGIAVAGLGTALTTTNTAAGALGGITGGATTGAMMGGIPGAIAGAILGGLGGALTSGARKRKLRRKEAQAAIIEVLDETIFGAINTAAEKMRVGSTGESTVSMAMEQVIEKSKELNDLAKVPSNIGAEILFKNAEKYGLTFTKEQIKKIAQDPQAAYNQFIKQSQSQSEAASIVLDEYNKRMEYLQNITGKTEQELVDLARTMGVNLTNVTVDLREQMDQLGIAVKKTAAQINESIVVGAVDNLEMLRDGIEAISQPYILDEMLAGIRQRVDAGEKFKPGESASLLADVYEQMLILSGNKGPASIFEFERQFGRGGLAYTQKESGPNGRKGYFYGLEGTMLAGESGALIDDFIKQNRELFAAQLADQITAYTGKTVDSKQLTSMVMSADMEQLSKMASFFTDPESAARTLGMYGGKEAFGLTGLRLTYQSPRTAIDQEGLSEETQKALETFITSMGDTIFAKLQDLEGAPEWFSADAFRNLFKELGIEIKDTRTPRGDTTTSRLSQTMARHSQLNSMLTGTRSITSSYRTTGLGSINSDHVMGRAYDLVGQNLGQYQRLVQQSGGFAEFHGVNGARHLHVVPNVNASGDSSTPTTVMTRQSSSSGGNNYYFTINGGPNAGAEEVANLVMSKIRSEERSRRERR